MAIALMAALSISCGKEQKTDNGRDNPKQTPGGEEKTGLVSMTFSASFDDSPATAAALSGNDVNWEYSDHIAVFDGVARRDFTVKEGSISGGTATFEGEVDEGATSFIAVYPYSASTATQPSAGSIEINYPASQTLTTSAMAPDAMICVAQADKGSGLSFRNVAARLKIHIPGSDVTAVTLSGNKTEYFAGSASVSTAGEITSTGDASSITLYPSGSTFSEGDYYFGLLPVEFTEGFTLVYEKSGGKAFVDTDKDVEFLRNGGKDVTASTASLTWVGLPIMDEDDLKAFADYSRFFSSSETVRIGADIALTSAWTPFPLWCTLDGQNHKITGLSVSAEENAGFVSILYADAALENLEVSGSISLTGTGSLAYAALVADTRGAITSVTNRVSVTHESTATCPVYLGGIAGLLSNGGSISSSYNYGAVALNGTSSDVSFIGGVVGYMQAGCGNVINTDNHGTVSCANTYGQGIGGIAGMIRGAKIDGCTNESTGVITVSKCKTGGWGCFVAGIAAFMQNNTASESSIENCTNKADISTEAQCWGVAGIAGITHYSGTAAYKINGCTNNGDITWTKGGTANVFCGGILAIAEGNSLTVSGNTNSGAVEITGNRTADNVMEVGGIIGTVFRNNKRPQNGEARTVEISSNTNEGSVTFKTTGTATGVAGGIIGGFSVNDGTESTGTAVTVSGNTSKGAIVSTGAVGGIFATCYSTCKYLTVTVTGSKLGCTLNGADATAANASVYSSNDSATTTVSVSGTTVI